MNEDFWKTVDTSRGFAAKNKRTGALNVALIFGTAVIALSLIVTPMLANRSQSSARYATKPDEIDDIITGSIKRNDASKTYTIRKSILSNQSGDNCVVEGYSAGMDCR